MQWHDRLRAACRHDVPFTLGIALASLVPRLYVAMNWSREPVWDGHYYDFGARRIAAGLGYSDDVVREGVATWHPWCHYPVGYSGFLAAVYRFFGDGPHAATVANAIIGALTVALVHRLARHMMGAWRARIAAILCAAHPGLIVYSGLVMTELLAGVLPIAALCIAIHQRDKHPWRGAAAGGLLLGAATLVNPTSIVLVPAVALPLVTSTSWRAKLRDGSILLCVVGACALCTVLPWTIRNCRVMDGCAFVSTNGGWNLAIGSFSRATGRFETLRASDGCEVVTGQVQQDRCWAHLGVQAIKADPMRWIRLAPKKLEQSFNHESFPIEYLREANPAAWPESRRVTWRGVLTTAHRVLMSLAVFGFLAGFRRKDFSDRAYKTIAARIILILGCAGLVMVAWTSDRDPFYPLAIAMCVAALIPRPITPRLGSVGVFVAWSIATFILVHVVFFGEDRYHIPLVPLLCIAAAGALRTLEGHLASQDTCRSEAVPDASQLPIDRSG